MKFYDIFEHIEKKLYIDFGIYTCESKGENYLKTSVSNETCFREGKNIFTPNKNAKYTCRVLLQIQSVFFNMTHNEDEIEYYPQVLLEQCVYKHLLNNTIVHPDLEFTDTEPDFEFEEEINENTVLNE